MTIQTSEKVRQKGGVSNIKRIRDETIIDALLTSATVRSAAGKLGINEQTIYRRKRDAEFMRKYDETRRERTEAARNVLQATARDAAITLAQIMRDEKAPAQTRVNAAAEVLRQNVKYTEQIDIMAQLDELEKWRAETTDGKR